MILLYSTSQYYTMPRIIIFDGYWTRDDVKRHKNALFIFGDNNAGIGNGGQAIIRGLPNTAGIPTKKYPSNSYKAFYRDSEYEENKAHIRNAINDILGRSDNYKYLVLPADGFGTGLADLPNRAPKTYRYLVRAVNKMKELI